MAGWPGRETSGVTHIGQSSPGDVSDRIENSGKTKRVSLERTPAGKALTMYQPTYSPAKVGTTPYTNGDDKAVKRQRRFVRKLVRDLVAFAGTEISERKTRKARSKPRRVLFRRANTLTEADLDTLIREIGVERMMTAFDRFTQPELSLAAE